MIGKRKSARPEALSGAGRMSRYVLSNLLGVVGAIIGGVLGFYTFRWLWGHGFYGLMIPGAFLGLGCSILAQHPSTLRGVFCAVAAVGLSLFTEWCHEWFDADSSFQYFLTHVHKLSPVTLLMVAVGSFIAFWVGKDAGYLTSRGRRQTPKQSPSERPQSSASSPSSSPP
jgi:MFS family permease